MPYLRLDPDTYYLAKRQMFQFDTCQFCGCSDWDMRFYYSKVKTESQRGGLAHVLARRSCKQCSKTTALVKTNID